MPSLHILQGADKGRTFEVEQSPSLIGRNSPDIPLTDNTVSRRHAELRKENGIWILYDLNSANGSYVNGVKVAKTMTLKLGDQIRCGTTLIVFGGVQTKGISAEPSGSLRIDAKGNLVESDIMATTPSNEDSVILAGPEISNAVGNLRLLYDLSSAISSIFDRQQLLERVMDMIFDYMPTDRGFILVREEEEDEVKPMVVRYRSPEHSGEITVSHTIVDYVMSHQEGVICTNAMRDPRFAKGKSVHDYGIRSALCVPITVRERNIGVIYVDTTVATHTYAGEQLQLLTAIGFHSGLAMEHARLYQQGVQAERLAAAGETVAYLSHGIKNLLQSLQSAADMVELGLNREKLDIAQKGWSILQRNLNKVQNLVLNMLAFSKVRTPNLSMTQINQMVNETVELLTSQGDEKQVAIIADLDSNLPAVPIDADGIQQALLNLLLNALDAVEPVSGVVTIRTRYDLLDNEVAIEVEDNGKGIESNDMSGIFRAFHSTKGQAGTGLGLAVVKKIVEEHRGSVVVDTRPGEGTKFTLRLPATQEADADKSGTAGTAARRRGKLFPFRSSDASD